MRSDGEGRVSVVWVDDSTGNAEAYYSRSTDNGGTFSEPINVSRITLEAIFTNRR